MVEGMNEPVTQRGIIMERLREAVEVWFGPQGSEKVLLRKVTRGAWFPGDPVRPSAVCVDMGAEKAGDREQAETTKVKRLAAQVILNLEAEFGSGGSIVDWSDVVETLSLKIQNLNPRCGVLAMDVTGDDPVKVELMSGASEHVWIIDVECRYAVEVAAFQE